MRNRQENMSWDEYFMTMCFFVSMKSKDTSTKVGAIIVSPDKEIISTGFNGICRGVKDDIDLVERYDGLKLKYLVTEHAERNALYQAAKRGASTLGCSLYTQGFPCCDCARGIIQSGIKEVIVSAFWEKMAGKKWIEQSKISKIMFQEANITTITYNGDYNNTLITGMFDKNIFKLNKGKRRQKWQKKCLNIKGNCKEESSQEK